MSTTAEYQVDEKIPALNADLKGKWTQPNADEIKVSGQFATMSQATFDQIQVHSSDRPCPPVAGVMWKFMSKNVWKLGWLYRDTNEADLAPHVRGGLTYAFKQIIVKN